jgi:hypothetical protein
MKKIVLFALLIFAFLSNAGAQSFTHTESWKKLISALQNENWQAANTLSLSVLNKIPKSEQDGAGAALVRYMYIFSEAGLMNLNKVTKTEALKKVIKFKGHMVILPSHPVSLKNDFNSIRKSENKTDTLFITSTNKAATSIFSFEYIALTDKWPDDDFKNSVGKMYRLGGMLRSITVEGSMFPRFRIVIDNGIYKSDGQ